MKTLALLLASLLMAGCSGCASLPNFAKADLAAVRLELPGGGVCSATAVGTHTLLSATHCFEAHAGVMKVDGKEAGYVIVADDGNDHVLVRMTARQEHIAEFGPKPAQGAEVFIHGNPMAIADLLRVGRVAGWNEQGMLLTGQFWKGDSGAGILDRKGRIVGVISGMLSQQIWYITVAMPMNFSAEDLAKIA